MASSKWDIANAGNRAIREELASAMLAALEGSRDGDTLDAGCGTGWWLRRLAAAGIPAPRLHGIDRLPARVAAARAAVPGAEVAEGDVTALPYEDGRFKAVFMVAVLSTLPSREAVVGAVAEAWRVLAPGGVLVVWEPRVPTPLNRTTRLVRRRDIEAGTGAATGGASLTVCPPLARRLGRRSSRWYPRLARIPPMRTHRLHVCRRGAL